MDYIKEIIDFCNCYPEGALLFKGEWGCGKSYFIDKVFFDNKEILSNEKADNHVLLEKFDSEYACIKVSLFGVDSVNELHKAVKTAYLRAKHNFDEKKILQKILLVGKGIIKLGRGAANVLGGEIAEDALDFTEYFSYRPIKKGKSDEKKLFFVFDDLERCRMDPYILLGAINDYVILTHKNEPITKVLIIANENIMKKQINDDSNANDDNDDKRPAYEVLKEKIISKELTYSIDLCTIIASITEPFKKEIFRHECFSYLALLERKKDTIIQIFDGCNCKNIRMLKCALQNYYRFYMLLADVATEKKTVPDIIDAMHDVTLGWYLFNFLAKDSPEPSEYELDTQMQLYDLETYTMWIKGDEWDEERLKGNIRILIKQFSNPIPRDEVLYSRDYLRLDDDVFEKGITDVMTDAYEGKLSIDEYGRLLTAFTKMRTEHSISSFLDAFNKEKFMRGVDVRINELEKSKNKNDLYIPINEEKLASEEKELAWYIKSKTAEAQEKTTKNAYINLLKDSDHEGASKFDLANLPNIDTAIITGWYEYFSTATNQHRCDLIQSLRSNIELIRLNSLLDDLQFLQEKFRADLKKTNLITHANYVRIIDVIDEILKPVITG